MSPLMVVMYQQSWPPTPTPFPPGQAYFELPTQYFDLWAGPVDFWFQLWQWLGDAAMFFQAVLLLVLIVGGVLLAIKFFNRFTEKDGQS